jgi:hypothetical protein
MEKDFLDSEKKISLFIKLLDRYNINVPGDSYLKKSFDNLLEIQRYKVSIEKGLLHLPFKEEEIRQFIFLISLIDNILSIPKIELIDCLSNHLRLVTETNFAQNDTTFELISNDEKQKSNKLWELLFAIAIIRIGGEIIKLSDPYGTEKSKNVDIITKINNVRWGFECKTPNTKEFKAKTFIDLVRKGVEQIDNADVDKGIVCLNMRNVIKHEKYLNETAKNRYNFFDNEEHVNNIFLQEIECKKSQVEEELINYYKGDKTIETEADDLEIKCKIRRELFKCKPKISFGLINYYSVVLLYYRNNKFSFVDLHRLNPLGFWKAWFEDEVELANKINSGFYFDKNESEKG